jgi:hypothetical protein
MPVIVIGLDRRRFDAANEDDRAENKDDVGDPPQTHQNIPRRCAMLAASKASIAAKAR